MKVMLSFLLLTPLSITAHAADLSNKTLSGTWKFTHMILDGERTVPVNRDMKFLPSGEITNYDREGEEDAVVAESYSCHPDSMTSACAGGADLRG